MKITTDSGKEFDLQIGDEIFVGSVRGRGGHGAFVTIDKFNSKSIKGTERKGSYSPGTKWTIHIESAFAIVKYFDTAPYRREYWVNDR